MPTSHLTATADAATFRRPRRPALELLWHRRAVEVFGTLVRVRVPVVGTQAPATLAGQLSALLEDRWRGRTLSLDATVHTVVVEFHEADGERELVLLIATDHSPRDHSIVNARMIRDLRMVLRAMHLPAAGAGPDELAVAA